MSLNIGYLNFGIKYKESLGKVDERKCHRKDFQFIPELSGVFLSFRFIVNDFKICRNYNFNFDCPCDSHVYKKFLYFSYSK